jgi:hypothetical protein
MASTFGDTEADREEKEDAQRAKQFFVSEYTDGPATRWNVIDRRTQEWVRRFATEAEALQHADKLNAA